MSRWVPGEVSAETLREFVLNKSLHPHTLPAEKEDLYLEQALARHVLRASLQRARPDWPEGAAAPRADLLPWLSLILGGGSVLGQAPRPGLAAMLLLDGLQPSGITRLMLDPCHLTAALGAISQLHQMAAAQVYDSLAFVDLGTAISIVGRGPLTRAGDVVCQATLVPQSGPEKEVESRAGSIDVLPLAAGQSAKLTLRPRPGFNVGFGPGRGRTLVLKGGAVGIILDARGRPITFPRTSDERQQAVQDWTTQLGGGL
jgi:hypothetical protein